LGQGASKQQQRVTEDRSETSHIVGGTTQWNGKHKNDSPARATTFPQKRRAKRLKKAPIRLGRNSYINGPGKRGSTKSEHGKVAEKKSATEGAVGYPLCRMKGG